MNPLECKACFEEYHATTRRPRALPCGHSYCEQCLGILLTGQMIRCPTCRREHNVTEVTELMIVYDLIELLDSKQTNVTVSLNKGECEEHGCPLNFFCATHLGWICRDCTVLEHPKEKCSIKTKKQFVLEKVTKEKEKLTDEKDNQEKCQSSLRKNFDKIKKEIDFQEELITKLQTLLESQAQKKSSLEMEAQSVEQFIKETGLKHSELTSMISSISTIKDFNDLEVTLNKSGELIRKAQDWRNNEIKKYYEKTNSSSDEIKAPIAGLINLTLEFTKQATVHKGCICDECNTSDFQGARYKCLVCNDYDICAACEIQGLHGHHTQLRIPKMADWIKIDTSSGIVDSSGRTDLKYGPESALTLNGYCWNPLDLPRYHNNWYIILDLKASHTVIQIHIRTQGDTTHDIEEFKLESSTDNKNWISVGGNFVAETGTKEDQYIGSFYGTGRYWKFTVIKTSKGWQPWLRGLTLQGYQS